ncbi:MAG: hypothetical protein GXP05_14120 [Alphaproteobacteria bacterium]|nr:hypothetical protein [Alphaproteobacteria bacterium]
MAPAASSKRRATSPAGPREIRWSGGGAIALILSAMLLVFASAPKVLAAPQLAPTIDTCLAYSSPDKLFRADLQNIGWSDLGKKDLVAATKIFQDGLLLLESPDPRQKIDFRTANSKASDLVQQMWRLVGTQNSSGIFYFSGGGNPAVLMVSTGFDARRSWLQCTYAGPDDLYLQQLLKVTKAQDARAGVSQPSKNYQRGLLQGQKGLREFSVLAGQYLPGIAAEIGRQPSSAIGVSTISARPMDIALPTGDALATAEGICKADIGDLNGFVRKFGANNFTRIAIDELTAKDQAAFAQMEFGRDFFSDVNTAPPPALRWKSYLDQKRANIKLWKNKKQLTTSWFILLRHVGPKETVYVRLIYSQPRNEGASVLCRIGAMAPTIYTGIRTDLWKTNQNFPTIKWIWNKGFEANNGALKGTRVVSLYNASKIEPLIKEPLVVNVFVDLNSFHILRSQP